jgi:hypothetical protein
VTRKRQSTDAGIDEFAARQKAAQSAAAKRAARTRQERKRLSATPFGRLLLALREARECNDRAKSRAANGLHIDYYFGFDSSRYAQANYRRSRDARWSDYRQKSLALDAACSEAQRTTIRWGWAQDKLVEDAPFVIYFDLPSGQVSFHAEFRGDGLDYGGEWDGVEDAAWCRIEDAIQLTLDQPADFDSLSLPVAIALATSK